MTENQSTGKVTQALLESIAGIVEKLEQEGDTDSRNKLGPVLLTLGIMMMVQDIGSKSTAVVITELVQRIEKGEFDNAEHLFHRTDA